MAKAATPRPCAGGSAHKPCPEVSIQPECFNLLCEITGTFPEPMDWFDFGMLTQLLRMARTTQHDYYQVRYCTVSPMAQCHGGALPRR